MDDKSRFSPDTCVVYFIYYIIISCYDNNIIQRRAVAKL